MTEFMIQSLDGSWFEFSAASNPFVPTSIPYTDISTSEEMAISIDECKVSFSIEEVGIQVFFEGVISDDLAERTVSEIATNIENVTGQKTKYFRFA